jgi:hypothetical protein
MKVYIIVLLLSLCTSLSFGQKCDIAQMGVAVYDESNTNRISAISPGERANFRFSIGNMGTSTGCSIPANKVNAAFSFPTLPGNIRPYIYDGPASFVSGYFTWTYDAAANILRGINSSAVPNGMGDADVSVQVKGIVDGIARIGFNLLPESDVSDNDANNSSYAQLIVVASPVPIKLSVFAVQPRKCEALLNWTTLSEINFSHFEVEYSVNGRQFIKVGTVPGKNVSTGSNYNFAYTQLNGTGYYRLKLVDRDGRFEYSEVIHTSTNCKDQSKILVYPNPVQIDQKLVVNISGYTGKLTGELYNAASQKVKVYSLDVNTNELSVKELSAGVYLFKVLNDNNEVETFKIIVMR